MKRGWHTARRLAVVAIGLCFVGGSRAAEADPRLLVQVEALKRLKDINLEERPAVRQALLRVLDRVRGQPAFVELVRDFNLKDQDADLLDFARRHPTDPVAPDALRLLLARENQGLLREALGGDPASASVLLEPLGRTGDPRAVPLLLPMIADVGRDVGLRRSGLRAVIRSQEGAAGILQLAKENRLPADLIVVAAAELGAVRWRSIREEAARVVPPPAAKGDQALPPVAELVRRRGDATRGAQVFRRPEVNCIGCHKVRDEGVDFGPQLTEIGTKLGKDALIESILEPSLGISFGFEAWLIVNRNGDEWLGLITSETPDEVSLKLQGGAVQSVRKSEIARREKQALSIMPAGLQAALTTDEFVDLVEYLASLKKAAP